MGGAECYTQKKKSFLLDQMINEATKTLSNKSEPFQDEVENFIATQAEINAMVSNISTPKSKHNKNLINTNGCVADAHHQWYNY